MVLIKQRGPVGSREISNIWKPLGTPPHGCVFHPCCTGRVCPQGDAF